MKIESAVIGDRIPASHLFVNSRALAGAGYVVERCELARPEYFVCLGCADRCANLYDAVEHCGQAPESRHVLAFHCRHCPHFHELGADAIAQLLNAAMLYPLPAEFSRAPLPAKAAVPAGAGKVLQRDAFTLPAPLKPQRNPV